MTYGAYLSLFFKNLSAYLVTCSSSLGGQHSWPYGYLTTWLYYKCFELSWLSCFFESNKYLFLLLYIRDQSVTHLFRKTMTTITIQVTMISSSSPIPTETPMISPASASTQLLAIIVNTTEYRNDTLAWKHYKLYDSNFYTCNVMSSKLTVWWCRSFCVWWRVEHGSRRSVSCWRYRCVASVNRCRQCCRD